MKTILVTGAFGNVGASVLHALASNACRIRAFDRPGAGFGRRSERFPARMETVSGDIRDEASVARALEGVDAVVHLAAVIPPLADEKPELARGVNVGGTTALLSGLAAMKPGKRPFLVYSSSVAVYGDRVEGAVIKTGDPVTPNGDDEYGKQKAECEKLIRSSGLEAAILRLTYIVWKKKLRMDPLMFRMPPATRLEVCHTKDAGLALARAATLPSSAGGTFNIAGGERCRTTFRAYLDRMFRSFGLGDSDFLPDEAFASRGYHCGWMDTEESERLFRYQGRSLEDYYAEVENEARSKRFWVSLVRPIARRVVLSRSAYAPSAPGVPVPAIAT